jgi:uncharacterized membrane protein
VNAERFRTVVSLVLAVGVALSAALIGIGFIAALGVGWQGSLIGATHAIGRSTADLADLPARLTSLEPLAISQLGLLALIATPVVRVAVSVWAFALEGDRLYATITFAVLLILLTSLFLLH